MSAAEDAYRAAGEAIDEAKRPGAEALDFSGEAFRALETLPPGIGALDALRRLNLDNTQVSDLAPLRGLTGLQGLSLFSTQVNDLAPVQGLTGLQRLSLDGTQVLDLRPLQRLRRLADAPGAGGLTFRGIPATADPKIAEIAEIEDDAARGKALFALLDAGWVPPVAMEPVPPEPDPLLRRILIDGKL